MTSIYRISFFYFLVISMPVIGFIIDPVKPLSFTLSFSGFWPVFAISVYVGIASMVILSCAVKSKYRMLQSWGSAGLAISFFIFPMYFLLFFLGGPILMVYYAIMGWVFGTIFGKWYGIQFGT